MSALKVGAEARALKHEHEAAAGTGATNSFGFKHEVKKLCTSSKRVFLELFGGTCRLATAVANSGMRAESYELSRNPLENLLLPATRQAIVCRFFP